jgi:hypothetical protein
MKNILKPKRSGQKSKNDPYAMLLHPGWRQAIPCQSGRFTFMALQQLVTF